MDKQSFGVWHPQNLQPSLPRSAGYFAVQQSPERTAPTSLTLEDEHKENRFHRHAGSIHLHGIVLSSSVLQVRE